MALAPTGCFFQRWCWPAVSRQSFSIRSDETNAGRLSDGRPSMKRDLNYVAMIAVALAEARKGLAEGGIPIGAAIFDAGGRAIGAFLRYRVEDRDPSMHGETNAFRNAGRQRSYRSLIMVTTLAPCWYCSGLIRQFGFGTVVVGESRP